MNHSPFLTLAIGFASPWLLSGLVLAAIPLVLHMLHKRRFRETHWAAMKFLLEAARKNSKRLRLQQLILLAVRMLVLVFLVLTLSRPFVESAGGFFPARVPTHRIVVLDASFSMSYHPAGFGRFTLFDRALDAAEQIVGRARSGDALNLVRIARMDPRIIIRQPAFQKNAVMEELQKLQVSDERGDVLATLLEIVKLLGEAADVPQKEVSIISDFQSSGWLSQSRGEKAQIRKLLKQISQSAKLVLVDVHQDEMENVAITEFEAKAAFSSIDQPIDLRISLRNFGQTILSSQLLEVYIDGLLAETRRVELPAGAEISVDVTCNFTSPGEHRLEARLQDDALPLDNRRWLSLPVHESLNVLLVNGTPAGRDRDKSTYYVHHALSPKQSESAIGATVAARAGSSQAGFIRVKLVNESELASIELERFDCVFLCDVAVLTEREANILETYVNGGGGLVISLGPQVQTDNYNLQLYRDGQGLLPAKLGDRLGAAEQTQQPFYFHANELQHPIVQAFEGNPGAGLESTMTFQYVKAAIPETLPVRVALRFQPDDPAIVERQFGRGRVILITTAVDDRWGTWSMSPCFLPLMRETVLFAVAGRTSERQLTVGEAIRRVLTSRAYDVPVVVEAAGGEEQPLRLIEGGELLTALFEDTSKSGMYELKMGPPLNRAELYAVNVDSRESDLRKLTKAELDAELLQGIESVYRSSTQETDPRSRTAIVQKGGLSRWLLYATLCLLLVEQLMAWNFFYGFLLLYVLVAAALVRQALAADLLSGSALLLLVTGGCIAIVWRGRARRGA